MRSWRSALRKPVGLPSKLEGKTCGQSQLWVASKLNMYSLSDYPGWGSLGGVVGGRDVGGGGATSRDRDGLRGDSEFSLVEDHGVGSRLHQRTGVGATADIRPVLSSAVRE